MKRSFFRIYIQLRRYFPFREEINAEAAIKEFYSPNKKKYYSLLLFIGLLGILFFFFKSFLLSPEKITPPPSPQAPQEKIFSGKIPPGGTLSSALGSYNISPDLVEEICSHLSPLVNLHKIKAGDFFMVRLSPQGKLINFLYQSSPLDIYQLAIDASGKWSAQKKEIMVERYWAKISGEIASSLFEAINRLGEEDSLVLGFADIFASEIDFNSELQSGDSFKMVVEKIYVGGTFVQYGRILHAEYKSSSKIYQAIYFERTPGRGDYYTPQGDSLRKALLRSPLKFTRISSRYSQSRRHPILGGYRPHYGVDYAAPKGSPIWAIADGTVIFRGRNGGYGNQIIIKHHNGYKSMYGHLSRFAAGIRKGRTVQQKQIIGYVGSTGFSTGPHLDFRLLKNNAFRNPLQEVSPRAASLKKDQLVKFKALTDPLIAWAKDPSSSYRRDAVLNSQNLK